MSQPHSSGHIRRYVWSWLAVASALVVLDLLFLGVIAADFFQSALGPLRAKQVVAVAAALFYVMYVTAIAVFAVARSGSVRDAWTRGAWMGAFAYSTYELTNWAVIADWPARMVPVDIIWGVLLTSSCAWVGKRVWLWSGR